MGSHQMASATVPFTLFMLLRLAFASELEVVVGSGGMSGRGMFVSPSREAVKGGAAGRGAMIHTSPSESVPRQQMGWEAAMQAEAQRRLQAQQQQQDAAAKSSRQSS